MNRVKVINSHVDGTPNLDVRNRVAFVFLEHPPVNALSFKVRTSILASFERAEQSPDVDVIVLTGKGRAFSAGADISEFSAAMKEPFLPEVIDRVEQSKKIVIAAVNGLAMGGGMEIALGCHYRLCSQHAIFALPEIKLGLIPGAGGTQRLPRCVGVINAIDVCCRGGNVKPQAALKMGLVEKIVPHEKLLEEAAAFGLDLAAKKVKPRRLCDDASKLGNFLSNRLIFRSARQKLGAKVPPGFISPLKALDAVQAATQASCFKDGMEMERKIFMDCAKSPQAAAMQHLFFSRTRALKVPSLPADVKPRVCKKAGVIGGGTMGGGIAMNFLNVGIPVVLIETNAERQKFCVDTVAKNYQASVVKGKLPEEKFKQRMSLLTVVVNDYSALADVDIVIEAVFESMALKKEIFAKLDAVCKPNCVLATNTSTLNIDEIASATKRPQKVIGAHFFSPANVMPLLEFVRGATTDAHTIVTSLDIGKKIKKQPVVVGNCFGFVSNRMIMRGGFQCMCMLEEGALPREVDAVVKGFGFPMGLFAMQDLAGLDVGAKIRLETPKNFIPKRDVTTIPDALNTLGRHGQKTLKGWYSYTKENPRTPVPDSTVEKLIIASSAKKGIKRRMISKEEILERYIYSMVNEAAILLEEGIAVRPSDIDIVFIFGFGFPAYKGGPCHYADFIGIPKIVAAIQKYNTTFGGDTFSAPCTLLLEMAKNGKTFASHNNN